MCSVLLRYLTHTGFFYCPFSCLFGILFLVPDKVPAVFLPGFLIVATVPVLAR